MMSEHERFKGAPYWAFGRWECPACGAPVLGGYWIDESRKRCSKTKAIHRALAVHVEPR